MKNFQLNESFYFFIFIQMAVPQGVEPCPQDLESWILTDKLWD